MPPINRLRFVHFSHCGIPDAWWRCRDQSEIPKWLAECLKCCFINRSLLRIWWNWQTRYFEVVVRKLVQVQVLLCAPTFRRVSALLADFQDKFMT